MSSPEDNIPEADEEFESEWERAQEEEEDKEFAEDWENEVEEDLDEEEDDL